MPRLKKLNTVLVIDDEAGVCQAVRMFLKKRYNVLTTDNPQEAVEIISSREVDVVMLDIKMPNLDGIKLLKVIKGLGRDTEIALITGYPSLQSAIEALRYGAYDYLIKPFDKGKIEQVVRNGIIRRKQRKLEKDTASKLMTEVYKKLSREK